REGPDAVPGPRRLLRPLRRREDERGRDARRAARDVPPRGPAAARGVDAEVRAPLHRVDLQMGADAAGAARRQPRPRSRARAAAPGGAEEGVGALTARPRAAWSRPGNQSRELAS